MPDKEMLPWKQGRVTFCVFCSALPVLLKGSVNNLLHRILITFLVINIESFPSPSSHLGTG